MVTDKRSSAQDPEPSAEIARLRGELNRTKLAAEELESTYLEALADSERQLSEARRVNIALRSEPGYVVLLKFRRFRDKLAPPGGLRGRFVALAERGFVQLITLGPGSFFKRLLQPWRWARKEAPAEAEEREEEEDDPRIRPSPDVGDINQQYRVWQELHPILPSDIIRMRRESRAFAYRPKISIVMPTYNSKPEWLDAAINSVRDQYYDNWELCIADDCSPNSSVRAQIERRAEGDDRIKVTCLTKNQGIAGASNAALSMASGEFVAFLDHDDELKPYALYEVVKLLNQQPDLDYIYSDEDKRDFAGHLAEPFFKPDWSPDFLRSVNYVCHLSVYRRSLVEALGGLRSECDFSQDYDLVLRVSERTKRIAHIPVPLYTWRMAEGSAAEEENAKPQATDASKKALSDHLQRTKQPGRVEDGLWPGTFTVRYEIKGSPLVSIIIPTKDKVSLLRDCVESVRLRSDYQNFEVIIVDNGSVEAETKAYFDRVTSQDKRVRVMAAPGPFNFSVLNNDAVRKESHGEHLLFLNNDTEVMRKDWLNAMVEHSQRPEVGAVGARLLYKDGRVQHAGVLLGLGGVAGHAFQFQDGEDPGYQARNLVTQNYSAVTAACMMMRRDVFDEVGGFNERDLTVAFGDVDLCIRIREKGYLIVWTPYAELHHYESASRGYEDSPEKIERFQREINYMKRRWGPVLHNDPFYNPNLTRAYHDFRIDTTPPQKDQERIRR